jgi:hypothetical protein
MLADPKTSTQQNSYTYDELLKCSEGELFGPGNAQLPAPNMLMFDLRPLVFRLPFQR